MVLLMISFSVNASATSSTEITSKSIKDIKTNLSAMGVDSKTQNSLIDKLKSGQIWDSMNPEMQDKGIVSTTSSIDLDGNKVTITKTVYPDGSVSVVSITVPSKSNGSGDIVTPQDVGGGSSSCGSGYCNTYGAKVDGGNGVVTASFLADYSIVNGGYDSILKVYQPSVKVYFGSYENVSGPNILRAQETQYQSARAYMSWTYKSSAGSATQYLNLDIRNNVPSSSFTT